MKNSNIQWTDNTFNPWEGCTKVSPGCLNCYAETRNIRFTGGANWGKGAPRRRTSAANWKQPAKWNAAAAAFNYGGERPKRESEAFGWRPNKPRVFCASLADWLDDEVPIAWLADLLALIHDCKGLDWQLLTKRPQNWEARILAAEYTLDARRHEVARWLGEWDAGMPPKNVWLGVSAEDQKRADERIPLLFNIPAKIRFLSVEPMLERITLQPVSLAYVPKDPKWRIGGYAGLLNWVICGGESGPNARPFFSEWAHDLRHQCKTAGVPFFMKQFGSNPHTENANALDWPDGVKFQDSEKSGPGAAAAEILLKDRGHGGDISEFPEALRVREFPS